MGGPSKRLSEPHETPRSGKIGGSGEGGGWGEGSGTLWISGASFGFFLRRTSAAVSFIQLFSSRWALGVGGRPFRTPRGTLRNATEPHGKIKLGNTERIRAGHRGDWRRKNRGNPRNPAEHIKGQITHANPTSFRAFPAFAPSRFLLSSPLFQHQLLRQMEAISKPPTWWVMVNRSGREKRPAKAERRRKRAGQRGDWRSGQPRNPAEPHGTHKMPDYTLKSALFRAHPAFPSPRFLLSSVLSPNT